MASAETSSGLTILVPAYNEAASIADTVLTFHATEMLTWADAAN